MYEIDFLPVESENGSGSKSGDAISVRFTLEDSGREAIVVIDGGFQSVGENLVAHIDKYYGTRNIDLVISTHPDADHLNGLATVIEEMKVEELMVHQPRSHGIDTADFSNIEALDNLIAVAKQEGTKISEPFMGETRLGGQLTILGPTRGYYEELIQQHLEEARAGSKASPPLASIIGHAKDLWERAMSSLPFETLTDDGETSPRNNTSAITLIQAEGQRLLFTGDAGIPALEKAADYYEGTIGLFRFYPLDFFQAPHHGSRRNLGPSILNRILGQAESPHARTVSFISSAKASTKHPSPKIVNALIRRGCEVYATEGRTIHHGIGAPSRYGWTQLDPMPALQEDDSD